VSVVVVYRFSVLGFNDNFSQLIAFSCLTFDAVLKYKCCCCCVKIDGRKLGRNSRLRNFVNFVTKLFICVPKYKTCSIQAYMTG